jgi:hypothetical protein
MNAWSQRLRRFAIDECRGTSTLYETLALALADDRQLVEWLDNVCGPRARATLPFAAVHDLLLCGVPGRGLEAFYPNLTAAAESPTLAYPAFRAFLLRESTALAATLATRTTQTNEVARCAYLLPAFVLAAELAGRPLWIVDVGCSAGLNLNFDRYAYDYDGRSVGEANCAVRLQPELRGPLVPTVTPIPTPLGRAGIDLDPIDADDDDATRWLRACTWPEHVTRFRNLDAALAIARRHKPNLVKGDVVDVLPAVADTADPDAALVIVNTNVMVYCSRAERRRYGELLAHIAGNRELFWIANEHPAVLAAAGFRRPVPAPSDPAVLPLTLTHFRNLRTDERCLAWIGPHGRWLEWLSDRP